MGFPGATSGKEPACQCRRYKRGIVNPWVGKIPWRRAWLPTPVFLPGKSHGWRSLAGYSPWGHTELDTTEWLSTHSGTEVVDYRLRLFGSSLVLHPSCWTKTLCLWLIPPCSPQPSDPGNHHFALRVHESDYFGCLTEVASGSRFVLLRLVLLHLACCPPGSPILPHISLGIIFLRFTELISLAHPL